MKAIIPSCVLCLIVILTGSIRCFADVNVPALKDVFAKTFLIGAAVNDDVVSGKDPQAAAIVEKQFNTITAENVMKWMVIHPEPNKYDFAAADRFVEFGQKNKMFIIGHTLVWQNQIPASAFKDDANNLLGRDAMLARMKWAISKNEMVSNYRRGFHRQSVRICSRGRPQCRIVLQ
jgi:endo-1,4-beta-xylanase